MLQIRAIFNCQLVLTIKDVYYLVVELEISEKTNIIIHIFNILLKD